MATNISEKALNITQYALRDLPTSRTGLRLITGLKETAELYGIYDIKGFDLQLLGKTAKALDSIFYIPKFVGSVESFVLSISKFETANKTESVVKIIFASIKVIGNGAASMKFFVGLGLSFYVSKTSLGYIKNTCSVVSAVHYLYDGFVKTHSNPKGRAEQQEFKDQAVWEVLTIISSIGSNGLGGLTHWIGKEGFEQAGRARMPDWTWPALCLMGSVGAAVKEYKD